MRTQTLSSVSMTEVVGHVDTSCTQEACGFVQSLLICYLRLVHLSIELLSDLPMALLDLSSPNRILISTASSSHLNVLFVVKSSHVHNLLLGATHNLRLLQTRRLEIGVIVLRLTREEILRVSGVVL